jgi:hypothetical protein
MQINATEEIPRAMPLAWYWGDDMPSPNPKEKLAPIVAKQNIPSDSIYEAGPGLDAEEGLGLAAGECTLGAFGSDDSPNDLCAVWGAATTLSRSHEGGVLNVPNERR